MSDVAIATTSITKTRARALHAWLPWIVGIAAGLVVLGPALTGGSLLSLDLVVTPITPVPRGVWGLGPELPRRVPLNVPLAWASRVIGGPMAWKLVALTSLATACAGAWRLARGAPVICRAGAGVLYALSPYALTRLGAGHLGLVVAMALLPWALPTLLRPGRSIGRTFLWSAALACAGIFGGSIALVTVAVGLISSRGRRAPLVVAAFIAAQLPWLVPGAVVLAQGGRVASASEFATQADGAGGFLRVLAGHGFWISNLQVGDGGGTGAVVTALLGLTLAGLALLGARDLPAAWRRPASWLAATGLALALASAVPGVRAVYDGLTGTRLGGPFREGQRFLSLYLVWMAPAAALGAARVARWRPGPSSDLLRAAPLAAALVLAGPGLLGIDGRLEPVSFPPEWRAARGEVTERPGTVLALPWRQYLQMRIADNRNVFNPTPIYFGGDVLASSDPGFQSESEQADAREPSARRIAARLRAGERVSSQLARLGVRWVVLLRDADWQDYDALARDPGLEHTVAGGSLDLFRVRSWRGPVVDDAGDVVDLRGVVEPFGFLDRSDAATWYRPAADGWMRGWNAATATSAGLVRLPGGSGPIWYWPSVAVIVGDAVFVGIAVTVGVRALRRRRYAAIRSSPSD